jgi:hypothetical protein
VGGSLNPMVITSDEDEELFRLQQEAQKGVNLRRSIGLVKFCDVGFIMAMGL